MLCYCKTHPCPSKEGNPSLFCWRGSVIRDLLGVLDLQSNWARGPTIVRHKRGRLRHRIYFLNSGSSNYSLLLIH